MTTVDRSQSVWTTVYEAASSSGLASLPAARLALAAIELLGSDESGDSSSVEVVRVPGDGRPQLELLVRGSPTRASPAPSLEAALHDAACRGFDAHSLLAAALATVEQQADRLAAADTEACELRAELDETNRGLLAVYAELSDHQHQLELARAAAEQSSHAKAAFLANMSHEIRSPLNAVVGFTGLLRDTELNAEQAEYVDMVQSASNHLRGVIDDVLDVSKIESGHLELEDIPFDLVTCVEEAVGIVAPAAEQKGLALAALFALNTPVSAVGDPVRLRQILVNLLSNAVKFTAKGEIAVEVEPQSIVDDRCELILRVRDTGVGIPADAIDRVFAPFTQADASTTRNFGGTGLGLTICRQLCALMGGGIAVDSEVGVGTTFTCTVSVRLVDAMRLNTGIDRPLSGMQVLVVHEQPLTADAISRHLATWGADTVTATTIADATRRAGDWREAEFAVVAATGEPDALAVAADLLATARGGRHLPIVAVATLASRQAACSAQEVTDDVRAVVSAPVQRRHLRRAVLGVRGRCEETGSEVVAMTAARALRILLAEDNPVNQRATTLMLERLGYSVDVVGDGEQALAAILGGDYDLVFMDLHMPHLDGIAATREVRDALPGSRPRIVAMTAGATAENRRACAMAGMNDFLAKPVELADMARVIAATPDRPVEATDHVVLYVDDDPMVVTLVERILGGRPGLRLLTTSDGDAAPGLAVAHGPVLVLIDLHLADTSGEVVLRRLRADDRTRSVPVVIVSGDTSPATIERLTALGASAHLAKPFTAAALRTLVDSTLFARLAE